MSHPLPTLGVPSRLFGTSARFAAVVAAALLHATAHAAPSPVLEGSVRGASTRALVLQGAPMATQGPPSGEWPGGAIYPVFHPASPDLLFFGSDGLSAGPLWRASATEVAQVLTGPQQLADLAQSYFASPMAGGALLIQALDPFSGSSVVGYATLADATVTPALDFFADPVAACGNDPAPPGRAWAHPQGTTVWMSHQLCALFRWDPAGGPLELVLERDQPLDAFFLGGTLTQVSDPVPRPGGEAWADVVTHCYGQPPESPVCDPYTTPDTGGLVDPLSGMAFFTAGAQNSGFPPGVSFLDRQNMMFNDEGGFTYVYNDGNGFRAGLWNVTTLTTLGVGDIVFGAGDVDGHEVYQILPEAGAGAYAGDACLIVTAILDDGRQAPVVSCAEGNFMPFSGGQPVDIDGVPATIDAITSWGGGPEGDLVVAAQVSGIESYPVSAVLHWANGEDHLVAVHGDVFLDETGQETPLSFFGVGLRAVAGRGEDRRVFFASASGIFSTRLEEGDPLPVGILAGSLDVNAPPSALRGALVEVDATLSNTGDTPIGFYELDLALTNGQLFIGEDGSVSPLPSGCQAFDASDNPTFSGPVAHVRCSPLLDAELPLGQGESVVWTLPLAGGPGDMLELDAQAIIADAAEREVAVAGGAHTVTLDDNADLEALAAVSDGFRQLSLTVQNHGPNTAVNVATLFHFEDSDNRWHMENEATCEEVDPPLGEAGRQFRCTLPSLAVGDSFAMMTFIADGGDLGFTPLTFAVASDTTDAVPANNVFNFSENALGNDGSVTPDPGGSPDALGCTCLRSPPSRPGTTVALVLTAIGTALVRAPQRRRPRRRPTR